MNEHDISKAFDNLTGGVNPEAVIRGVRSQIRSAASKKRLRFPKAALLAAALILLLTVSAGAYAVYHGFSIELPEGGIYDYILRIGQDGTKDSESEIPVLTEEVLLKIEAIRSETQPVTSSDGYEQYGLIEFDTWRDAADWIDCGLLTGDTVMSEKPALWAYYENGTLQYLTLYSQNAACTTDILIPVTGSAQQYEHFVRTGTSDTLTETRSFDTSGGLHAEIVITGTSDVHASDVYASGYVIHGGIIYRFDVTAPTADEAAETIRRIADTLK